MRIGIVTREWPPDVYGGAGVHIEHLVAALRALPASAAEADDGGLTVDVHCFGEQRPDATAHAVPPNLQGANGALQAIGVDVVVNGSGQRSRRRRTRVRRPAAPGRRPGRR